MKPFTSSIRRHLLCWLLIPILTICFVGGCVTYVMAVNFATDAYDDALLDNAHSVANRLRYTKSELTIDMPPAARAILKHGDKDVLYYQIIDAKGQVINGDIYIPDAPPNERISPEPIFFDGAIEGMPVRIGIIEVPSQNKNSRIVIKVAETITGRSELIQSILLGVLVPQVVLIFLAAFAVWLGVARGLTPLNALKEAVESRNPSDLRPLSEENVPKEVKPLVIAINKLLIQVQDDRDAQKRFLSNAAHQLRTPLAGLKTQTELALRQSSKDEIKESLKHIGTSAMRATRLAQQLLALARVEPAVFKNMSRERLDLNSVARDVTRELVPQALAKDIDLGFEDSAKPQFIEGDRNSLYEMLFNLVENAVLYTQTGGQITVRVQQSNGHPVVSVEDNGPGIPSDERSQVFERFYRILGNKESGSGLGLAIVREIADAHHATIELKDGAEGKGALFEARFQTTLA
ncbi:MAG: sensor histidine kinase N-terminal domain-containing protein [Candidatus Obscuribacterales bacterium]|jgi:two-component system sensor histidine kinase TctE|nr:sensor histidine kinase N-terminal domain-containing protein [Candidatus Obscuribacterales bacterium]